MKMWLTLRRIVAISEMIGLPHAARAVERAKNAPSPINPGANLSKSDEARLLEKAETWAAICMVDRIAAMMFNLPAGTKRYQSLKLPVVDSNGQVLTRAYLSNLADIAKQVYDLDDGPLSEDSDAELYADVLRIDQEMNSLASLPPQTWWSTFTPGVLGDQLLQYWHYYITVRIHLKLTLQHDGGQKSDYSRYTCMNACSLTIRRYLTLRRALPTGFFVGRVVDLQVLTAAVVLLLAYHNSTSDQNTYFHAKAIESPGPLIAQLIELMDSISCLPAADFATQAVVTIRSLSALLEDDSASQRRELNLTVPLLGKIYVRKNRNPIKSNNSQHESSMMGLSQAGGIQNVLTPTTSELSGPTLPLTNAWSWDPLYLFIEDDDREAFFHSALRTEDFEQVDGPMNFVAFEFSG